MTPMKRMEKSSTRRTSRTSTWWAVRCQQLRGKRLEVREGVLRAVLAGRAEIAGDAGVAVLVQAVVVAAEVLRETRQRSQEHDKTTVPLGGAAVLFGDSRSDRCGGSGRRYCLAMSQFVRAA